MEVVTENPQETAKLAKKIARDLLNRKSKKRADTATVIALEGDLGGGKTTFTQGFAKGLGVKEKILSPTFVLIKRFTLRPALRQRLRPASPQLPVQGEVRQRRQRGEQGEHTQGNKIKNKNFSDFYHIDCYRINNAKEISDLSPFGRSPAGGDFEKIINNPKNIVMIEWAERIKEILPKKRIDIRFEWVERGKRKIVISGLRKIRN